MSHAGLEIEDLRVTYPGPPPVYAVDGISLRLAAGEWLGIVGESGSGKSTLAQTLLGLLEGARIDGTAMLGDIDLLSLDEQGWRALRWRRLALAFQSPQSLNPVLRVGQQIAEPLRTHLGLGGADADRRVTALLEEVGLGGWAADRHPGQLSGGQRRLVLLAMALSCDPEVLVLDEPTAGLDPGTRASVAELLGGLRREGRASLLVLTHDLELLHAIADRTAILYRGWLAETGPAGAVLEHPRSPYGRALLDSRPRLSTIKELRGIRGEPPNPTERANACPFFGRCTQGIEGPCTAGRPPLVAPDGEDGRRLVACVRGGVVTLLSARGIRKEHVTSTGLLRRRDRVAAVDGVDGVDVDVDVDEGEVVGLVGATGAGKSTLAGCLLGLIEPDAAACCSRDRTSCAPRAPSCAPRAGASRCSSRTPTRRCLRA